VSDYRALVEEIEGYERILADEQLIFDMIRDDVREIAAKFDSPRLTQIEDADVEDFDIGDLIPEHNVVVTISHTGYVKRLPIDTYRQQRRGGAASRAAARAKTTSSSTSSWPRRTTISCASPTPDASSA
jgi:DNA gyrase subunit A